VSGVSIRETYGGLDVVKSPGAWAAISGSSSPPPTGTPNRYFRAWGYPDRLSGQVPIVYDGTGSPKVGSLDIAVNEDGDVGFYPRYIARVNVYMVARSMSSAFIVTSRAGTVSGHSLTLDHPLLNNDGNAKVFA
jgi:hypothetical protein